MQEIRGSVADGDSRVHHGRGSSLRRFDVVRVSAPLLLLHCRHLELGGRGGNGCRGRSLLVCLLLLLLIESGDVVVHEEGVGLIR